MKQDDKITKQFLLNLFRENNRDLKKDFNEAIIESEKRTAKVIIDSEKNLKKLFIENIKVELTALRKEFKEQIGDTEKRLKGSLMLEIKDLTHKITDLKIREYVHYSKLMDKIDWLVGSYKKFETEHDLHSEKITEHTGKLDNYFERLKSLEVRVAQPA